MIRTTVAIVLAVFALSACKPHYGEAPATHDSMNQEASTALGSTVPVSQFDRGYWQRLHDTETPEWREAKRLCEQTILENYPNCLPVNDILQADREKEAEISSTARAKNEEMYRRGYQFDDVRKQWLPFHEMQAAGCTYSYPKIGQMTWQCPLGTVLPLGIPDQKLTDEGK
jgi:hypothetical protein